MDISNRGGRPVSVDNLPNQVQPSHQPVQSRGRRASNLLFHKLTAVIVLVSVSVVLTALITLFVFVKDGRSEKDFIKTDKYQAIFLNDANGQVYFGRLGIVNDKFYSLTDIFYVRVQQVQPSEENQNAQQNISLAKLGNELHGPEDAMFIARDKVLFWENLKDDGQVVKAIKEYLKNPEAAQQQQQQQQDAEGTDN